MIQKNIQQLKIKSINHTFHLLLACFFAKRRFLRLPIEKVLYYIPIITPITNLLLLLPAAFAGGPDIIANGMKTAVLLTG
jgi:hypothetical protein